MPIEIEGADVYLPLYMAGVAGVCSHDTHSRIDWQLQTAQHWNTHAFVSAE